MIEIGDRVYAGNPVPMMKITDAFVRDGYTLEVVFNGTEHRLFDGTSLFDGPVFEPLKDVSEFRNYKLDFETLTWLDGEVDIAPEYVYDNSVKIS